MPKLTDEEFIQRYIESKRQGKTLKEFAKEIGKTTKAVDCKLYKLRKKGAIPKGNQPEDTDPEPEIGKFSDTQNGNFRTVESTIPRITTLEELLDYCQVDLAEWRVERFIVNKWEVGAKTARRKLKWEDGAISEGFIDDPGRLEIAPLFQVKAWLVRTRPISISPTIQPVTISPTPSQLPQKSLGDRFHHSLVIPDMQFGFNRNIFSGDLDPFHDRLALDIVLQVAEKFRFDSVIYLGDVLDLPDWSDKFFRSPEMYFSTQSAIVELAWWLSQIRRATPESKTVMLEGNHESRMPRALATHLNAAYQLRPADQLKMPPALSVDRLLGLPDLKIEWVDGYPDSEYQIAPNYIATHGDVARSAPGDTVKSVLNRATVSTVFGHIHRIERASKQVGHWKDRRTITAISPGCLCRVDGIVPGHVKGQNWNQGFAVIHYDDSGFNQTDIIEIQNGKAYYLGESFIARNHMNQIRKDTEWRF